MYNSSNNPGMSDVGCYVPEKSETIVYLEDQDEMSLQDSQPFFDTSNSLISPEKETPVLSTNPQRKRKISLYIQPHSSKTFCDNNDNDHSSDNDGENNTCASKKRKCFQQTSKRSGALSMPASNLGGDFQNKNVHLYNNRASLPHNIKTPEIRITPSSPGIDPNDPDYPEFYEGKLYIDSKNSSTSENNTKSEEVKITNCGDNFNAGACADTLRSSPSSIGFNEKEKLEDSVEILNDDNSVAQNHSDYDELQSTPELDVVLANVKNEKERQNCLTFAEKELKRKLSLEKPEELESTPSLEVIMAQTKNEVEQNNCINFKKKNLKRKLSEN
jgi:hypothetical protein